MLLWTWVYKYLLDTLCLILLGTYPEVELLDHAMRSGSFYVEFFSGTITRFPPQPHHFLFPATVHKSALFPVYLPNSCYFRGLLLVGFFACLIVAIVVDVRQNFVVALMCISLIVRDVEHFWPLVCLLWRNVPSSSLNPHFKSMEHAHLWDRFSMQAAGLWLLITPIWHCQNKEEAALTWQLPSLYLHFTVTCSPWDRWWYFLFFLHLKFCLQICFWLCNT